MLFFLLITIVIILLVLFYLKKQSKTINTSQTSQSLDDIDDLTTIDIDRIDGMEDGSEFELYIARLLVELGYNGVYKTQGSRDFGADVIFIDSRGNQTVIQAKRYAIENTVGLEAVQEVFASKRYYKARNAIVITSSRYSEPCETLAGVNHVLLIDRKQLIEVIDFFRNGQHHQAKQILEAEPRVILESWTNMKDQYKVIKKDSRAEKILNA